MTNLLCCFGKSEHTYSSSSYSCLFNASPVRAHLLASMCVPLREKEIDRECVWGVSEWMSQQVFECPSLYFPLCPPPLPNDRAAAAAAKLHIWINEKLQQSVFRPGQAKKVEVVWRKKAILIFAFFASRTNERHVAAETFWFKQQQRRHQQQQQQSDLNARRRIKIFLQTFIQTLFSTLSGWVQPFQSSSLSSVDVVVVIRRRLKNVFTLKENSKWSSTRRIKFVSFCNSLTRTRRRRRNHQEI